MAGITDRPLRVLAERFGAGLVSSEMVASAALSTGHAEMRRKLAHGGRLPHVVQLAGCEAEWMVRGAQIAADAGANIIDINLGCPSKRVTNGFAGSALMRVPEQALRLVEAVIGAVRVPVTVKMRLGWDDTSRNAAEIARRAADAGVQLITVHARTREQFYKGNARWHLVREVVDAVSVPVVVNGDVTNVATAREALRQSGAAGVMIGRGAQGRPWIVGQIGAALAGEPIPKAPEGHALAALVHEHYDQMLSDYGTALGLRVARKHLGWYLDAVPSLHAQPQIRKSLLCSEDPQLVHQQIAELFTPAVKEAA